MCCVSSLGSAAIIILAIIIIVLIVLFLRIITVNNCSITFRQLLTPSHRRRLPFSFSLHRGLLTSTRQIPPKIP